MVQDFWRPLTEFLHGPLEAMGLIDPADADRITVTDSPAEAVTLVRDTAMRRFGLRYPRPRRRWLLAE
jgi:predicted Rossmann-fold nucleotide-binding protein